MKILKEKAEELYRKDFESHSSILKEVTVPLTENQKTVLASFIYNCGVGAFKTSILDKLNAGDIKGVLAKFDEYIYVTNPKTGKKEPSQGLINRRKREKELFLTPDE